MADHLTDFIPCMLIPLKAHYLLLPNATIAEVIPLPRQFEPVTDKPAYWIGQSQWQSHPLPVINLESLVEGQAVDIQDAHKLCIVHGIHPQANVPVYAFPCFGVPQLIQINQSALKMVHNDAEDSPYLHYQIQIGNKIAYIPNLDNIETELSQ